ncbi:MAG: KEOPS complex subunit Pcc1 [Thermoplasmatota archaeon]
MLVEASSAPEGGLLQVKYDRESGSLVLEMSSEDLSTLRAMLNSYLGLASAAFKAASD